MTVLFTAKFVEGFNHAGAGMTVGRTYDVVDFNDYLGTYTIINDKGERAALDWLRFDDKGRASTRYSRV